MTAQPRKQEVATPLSAYTAGGGAAECFHGGQRSSLSERQRIDSLSLLLIRRAATDCSRVGAFVCFHVGGRGFFSPDGFVIEAFP